MPKARTMFLGLLPVLAALLILALWVRAGPPATPASASPRGSATPRQFAVRIESGLHPEWSADAAATATLALIGSSERLVGRALAVPKILSVEAWAGQDVPSEFGVQNLRGVVVWVVRAQGTFVAGSCPVAANGCPSDSSGFYLFDDTGQVIGSGFPLPSNSP